MRKLILIFSVILVMFSVVLFLGFRKRNNDKEEVTYSIKTAYSYLSEGPLKFDVKIYSNLEDSLLNNCKEAQIHLHDQKEESVLTVNVNSVHITNNTMYIGEEYFEYTISLSVDIDMIKIPNCYMTITFTNKTYSFEIGSFEIKPNDYAENILKITNLYGVRKYDNLTLAGIVITITNPFNDELRVTSVNIGDGYNVILNKKHFVNISDSLIFEDYIEEYETKSDYLMLKPNETKTYLLPIESSNDVFLCNCYMIFDLNGTEYYLSNFTYIKTNDLDALSRYLSKGVIYEV